MTQREKLIELLDNNFGYTTEQLAETFADYLLANGVVVLPCKVGDTFYFMTASSDLWKHGLNFTTITILHWRARWKAMSRKNI